MKERKEYLDVTKALLIILVVVLHIIQINDDGHHVGIWIMNFIQVFIMQAFFILNGMLFNAEKWCMNRRKEYVTKKIKTLIIPYVFFETIGAFFMIFIFHEANIKGAIFNSIAQWYNVGADWFLISLFFADILLFFISKLNVYIGYVIMIACLIFPIFIGDNHYIIFIGRSILALGFVLIGYYAKKLFINVKIVYAIIAFVITAIVLLINGNTVFMMCQINNPFLYTIGGISGTVFILALSKIKYLKILKNVGQQTLTIMGTHQNIIKIACKIITRNSIISLILIAIITTCCESVIIPIINKVCPKFIGK